MEKQRNDWTTVQSFTFPSEAHIAQSYLDSKGLQTFLKDELTIQTDNFSSHALGGVKLQVKQLDYEIAKDALIEGGFILLPSSKPTKIETISFPQGKCTHCPYCGSDDINVKKNPSIPMVVFIFFIGLLIPWYSKKHHCFECSKEWKVKKSIL